MTPNFIVEEPVEITVVNPDEKRPGFDMNSHQIIKEIPESGYLLMSTSYQYTREIDPVLRFVDIKRPKNGMYRVLLRGLNLGGYNLGIKPYFQDGTSENRIILHGPADSGSTSTFEIQFDSTPGSPLVVIRVASTDSALNDIEANFKLGNIDSIGVANSLRQKVENAALAAGRGNTNAARLAFLLLAKIKTIGLVFMEVFSMKTFMIPVVIAVLIPFLLPQTPSSAVDLDKTVFAREFFDSVASKIVVGGRYLTHGVRDGDPAEYYKYLKSLKNFETTFDTGGEFCVTTKKSER